MPNLVEIGQRFWRRRFLDHVNVFWLFRNYLPLEKGSTFHLNKIESSSSKKTLCQVWLKLAQRFWSRRLSSFVYVFSLFRNYLLLKKGLAFHWNKLESSLPKEALCRVCLKLAEWLWRRRFLNFVFVFSLFRNNLPLEIGWGP